MKSAGAILALFACAVPAQAASSFGSDCAYPEAAKTAGPAGNTDLAFAVAADGSLKDVKVTKPSPNAVLDAAAVLCVSDWHLPADQKWRTAVSTGSISIFWDLNATPPVGRPRPHVCLHDFSSRNAPAGIQGPTLLGFVIKADGTVDQVNILRSSGNSDLDQAGAACAATWRYKPAMKDGAPVDVPWKAEITWVVH